MWLHPYEWWKGDVTVRPMTGDECRRIGKHGINGEESQRRPEGGA